MRVLVRRRMLPWLLVSSLVVLPATSSAQEATNVVTLDSARSQQVQSALQSIEANKESFVTELIADWEVLLDSTKYNVRRELYPLAMKASPWRLLAASLVGDFETMTDVLLGKHSPGQIIAELDSPEAKLPPGTFAARTPEALGDSDESLVYTPLAPCRLVDTRGIGARTGFLLPGSPRVFDLEAQGLASGQGGQAACAGHPAFSHAAWAINVTVTGFSGNGGLKIWNFTGTEPTASVINYSTGHTPSVANGLVVTGCFGCADDIVVESFGNGTHVIIDVVGFFGDASVNGSAVTRVAGTATSIAANSFGFVDGGNCPSGTRLISGENDYSGTRVLIGESRQDAANRWTMWMVNNDALARSVTVFSRCMDIPAEDF